MEHATYGGSTASRTWACAGWRALADTQPPSGSSKFADRGTLLHNAMEVIMNADDGADPREVIGMEYEGIELTEELYHEKIVPAHQAVLEIFDTYGIEEWACEERVVFTKDSWGTGDLIGSGDVWALVLDFKFGDGVMVSPNENHQFLFYGSAGYHTKETADLFDDVEDVVFAVVQPSTHRDEDYEVWETKVSRLADYREPWLAKVDAAKIEVKNLAEDPDYVPTTCAGTHCKFCPAAPVCPQKTGDAQRALLMDPAGLELLATNLKLAASLKDWINDVESAAHSQLEAGGTVKGYKLVLKRANRKWKDAEKTAKMLARKLGGKKNVVEDKIITPAAAEKLAKQMKVELHLETLVESTSSGTTLAKVSDKRPAVLGGAAMEAALASIN